MKRSKMIGVFILSFGVITPGVALASWQLYYTGQAQDMFGSHGRGNFATRAECEAYRSSSAGFERNNSYCSGSDSVSSSSPVQNRPVENNVTDTRNQEEQRQIQLQKEQKERELELERQKKFSAEKDKLLGNFKGTGTTGTLHLKGSNGGIPGLKGAGSGSPGLELHNTGTGNAVPVDQAVLQEEQKFKNNESLWIKDTKEDFQQRLAAPNRWCSSISSSLKTKAPPLPYKKLDELQAGDVLLIEGTKWITKPDRYLSGNKESDASHTVIYLKEINGTRLFLDNQPGEGSRIVPENYIKDNYGHREMEVAKLAQPLNREEADRLYAAAKKMREQTLEKADNNKWFDNTTYGLWGKDDMVCSEADWALIKSAGREIPKSDDMIKKGLGIDFSPADFYSNEQYFLVTPMVLH